MPLTTKLEAVNIILGAAGEAPVSTLTEATLDVANAASILDELTRVIQVEGWTFNTEADVPLTRQSDGTIPAPANSLKIDVDPQAYPDVSPVLRGTRLYDAKGHSYSFPEDIKAEIVYLLPWDELPEPARHYITVRASRVFNDRFVGSELIRGFTENDEVRARMVLQAYDTDSADHTIFDSADTAWRLSRR
jgi:hypothetical protein